MKRIPAITRYPLLLCLQCIGYFAIAQKQEIQFQHITTTHGLSQTSINCMLKDKKGLMWFGTEEGLNKYDGYKFTVYKSKTNDPKSIVSNDIYSLLEDKDGNIWIAAITGGVSMYDCKTDSFINFRSIKADPRSLSGNDAYTIYEDKRGDIWVGALSGLNLFNKKTRTFTRYYHNPTDSSSLSASNILSMHEDKKGNFWVGTGGGLDLMNRKTGKFKHYKHDPFNKKSIAQHTINKIFEDSNGNMWIGTNSGLELFDRDSETFTHFKSGYANEQGKGGDGIVYAIAQDQNFLWVGASKSLSLFDIEKRAYIDYTGISKGKKVLDKTEIYSLLLDDQNILWVGTGSDGIYKYEKNLSRFMNYQLPHKDLGFNVVKSFAEDAKGNIWIGTESGLSYFDRKTNSFSFIHNRADKKGVTASHITVLAAKGTNSIWVGSHLGLDLFDPATGRNVNFIAREGTEGLNENVRCLFEDSKGNLWIGTRRRGVNKLDKKTGQFIKYTHDTKNSNTISANDIEAICEDRWGNIWFSMLATGVDVLSPSTNKIRHYNSTNSNMKGDEGTVLMRDSKNNIWLGTMDGGFSRYNEANDNFTTYTESEGLINNVINSIIEDRQGLFWISTNKGIARFDPGSGSFRNYSPYNGLQSDEFNVGAGFRTKNGEILMGGVNGFNLFDPAAMLENKKAPPVIITEFELFNKPVIMGVEGSVLKQNISSTKEITLSYDQSVFTFEFAALNYIFSEKNQYAYKLEGFDREWNYVGQKRRATYTNLSPGEYMFRVKAANNDGVWNEEGISVKIIITPPFWLTWWFKLGVVLLLVGSVFAFIKFRIKNIKKQKIKLQQLVDQQTLQLVDANRELEYKNRELEQFVYIASHDLQEPLRTTSSFVELLRLHYNGQLDAKADKYFTYIGQAADRMKILIRDLLDYSRIGQKKECQRVDCNVTLRDVLLDLTATITESGAQIQAGALPIIDGYPTEIKQLFQNLIVNAIKFRKKNSCPHISISAEKKIGYWQISFADNGIGIPEKHKEKIFIIFQRLHARTEYEGSGIGLAHCKKIIELHGGKIWVDSEAGKGSVFHFTLSEGLDRQRIIEQN